jgi:hypothetical protein
MHVRAPFMMTFSCWSCSTSFIGAAYSSS